MADIQTQTRDPKHGFWKAALDRYDDILHAKAQKKSKPSGTKDLLEFDKWFQNELPAIINARKEKYMTQDELVQLMKWKLSRGKFRPRLVELAGSNSDEDVQAKTKQAFKKAASGKVKAAIECLTPLKGIGPATASAILVAGCPAEAAFMADEPTAAILGTKSLKYSLPEYMSYMEGIKSCIQELNKQAPDYGWNAHKVELALWCLCLAKDMGIDLEQDNAQAKTDQLKGKDENDASSDGLKRKAKSQTPPCKKQKAK